MTSKPCRECKKKFSTEAVSCPNCGVSEPTKKINPKADSNEFEEIWLYAKPGYDSLKATYNYVTSKKFFYLPIKKMI